MEANLGSGLTAKCVTTPRLNCKTQKKRLEGSKRKYVSKIIKKPKGDHVELEMFGFLFKQYTQKRNKQFIG